MSKLTPEEIQGLICQVVDRLQEDCPFCHGSNLEAVNNDDRIEGWQIYCWACGCRGPEAQSEELAWKAWKQR